MESGVLAREDDLQGRRETRMWPPQSHTTSGLAAEASPQSSLALSFKILCSQVLAWRSSEQLCQCPPHTTGPQYPPTPHTTVLVCLSAAVIVNHNDQKQLREQRVFIWLTRLHTAQHLGTPCRNLEARVAYWSCLQ